MLLQGWKSPKFKSKTKNAVVVVNCTTILTGETFEQNTLEVNTGSGGWSLPKSLKVVGCS